MIISHYFNLARHVLRKIGEKRSPQWAKLEKEFLAGHPTCEACKSQKRLNVHHKKPFHLHPELELLESNLMTLCMDKDCHLLIGHGDNFKAYNPNLDQDIADITAGKLTLDDAAVRAKQNRIFS